MTKISPRAFAGTLSGLAEVVIPAGVTQIGDSAFEQCTKLAKAYFYGTTPVFGMNVFNKTATGFTVYYHVSKSVSWASFTLYSKQAFCNARINPMDGSAAKTVILAVTAGHAAAPAAPSRVGYTFTGWYRELSCTNAWNFTTAVITNDINLYAKWVLVVPAAPTSVSAASASYTSIKINWKTVANANGYEVYRASSGSGPYALAGSATFTSYTNTALSTGTAYYYKVRAYTLTSSAKSYGAWSAVVNAKPVPSAPAPVKAAPVTSDSIKVTWGAVAGATKYEIFRSASASGTFALLAETTALSYVNTGVSIGTTYYYRVRAYRLVGSVKVYGAYSSASAKASVS